MQEITSQDFESNINGEVCIVDFVAPWCQPCNCMLPILEDVENETGVSVFKVNVDDSPELAEKFRIHTLPSVVIMSKGEICSRLVGVKRKSEILEELRKA